MRGLKLLVGCLLAPSALASAQEIIKVPESAAGTVSRPDDLFELPPGEWHFAKQLWQGQEPCTDSQCEAGFTSGDLVVSAEHSGKFVRIIAGWRNCQSTAFSEMETGLRPSKSRRNRVAKQVGTVVKGLRKSCGVTMPTVPPLDAARLFSSATNTQPQGGE